MKPPLPPIYEATAAIYDAWLHNKAWYAKPVYAGRQYVW